MVCGIGYGLSFYGKLVVRWPFFVVVVGWKLGLLALNGTKAS